MKNIALFIIVLSTIHSNSQDKFFNKTCDCINKITENQNQKIISENIQNCFEYSINNYDSEINIILEKFVEENPEKNIEFAKRNFSSILSEKLLSKCPKFKEIDEKFSGSKKKSSQIIKKISSKICEQIANKNELTDEIVDPIIISTSEKYQVDIYGQYNLNKMEEMKRYSQDLNKELMSTCPKYKKYVIKRNRR